LERGGKMPIGARQRVFSHAVHYKDWCDIKHMKSGSSRPKMGQTITYLTLSRTKKNTKK